MTTTIGTSQATLTLTSIATVGQLNYYFTKFVSQSLFNTSISANTWTYNFAAQESASAANFPVNSNLQPVHVNCYVWRPSTSTKIGTVLDGNTDSTVNEAAPNIEAVHHVMFSGSAVSGLQEGDVLILEVWFGVNQADSVVRTDEFFYDGTTVNTTEGATVSNHASYLETPEDLNFTGVVAAASERRRLKYIDLNEVGLMGEIISV